MRLGQSVGIPYWAFYLRFLFERNPPSRAEFCAPVRVHLKNGDIVSSQESCDGARIEFEGKLQGMVRGNLHRRREFPISTQSRARGPRAHHGSTWLRAPLRAPSPLLLAGSQREGPRTDKGVMTYHTKYGYPTQAGLKGSAKLDA